MKFLQTSSDISVISTVSPRKPNREELNTNAKKKEDRTDQKLNKNGTDNEKQTNDIYWVENFETKEDSTFKKNSSFFFMELKPILQNMEKASHVLDNRENP